MSESGHWFESDPLWFKRAVFYEIHIRGFFDGNDDGAGDFRGLIEKLDYLQWLGIDCIWLLPMYISPLRDGGYDIADFFVIHEDYGTVDDFRSFVEAAHQRGMRVIADLVMNHTSNEHPWFQESRSSPDSPKRDWYVWSDTDQRYLDARIIFIDTEPSNWTWDPVAGQYYWHRFFSHQPDLNYDNPEVQEAMLNVLRFWLDLGIDGFRLDAVPYLYEREGTSGENLPETHEYLKRVRAEIDARYPDRVLLAEANQWPEDVVEYFGDGDECHMAFHFPVMPRMFMSLRREEARPILEILDRTPAIPENAQWGLFLRNHDELTLEMVTDEERDYMYSEYAKDPRMKLNLGIRRRLAPLLDNGRDEIELMHAILFSLPGAPVLYYGDEIGMGDNVYLGDRDGVRTPMQWTGDRNGGFSRADFAQLYLPPLMDPVYGFQAVNVEAELRTPTSLLRWLHRFIALRKEHPVFGLGTLRAAPSREPARLRAHPPLCGRHHPLRAQPRPLGAGGRARPLRVRRLRAGGDARADAVPADRRVAVPAHARAAGLVLVPAQEGRLVTELRELTQDELIEYVTDQRWYGSKGREVAGAGVVDQVELPGLTLALVEIVFPEGTHEVYQLVAGETLDGLAEPAVARELVHLIRTGKPQRTGGDGTVVFEHVEGFAGLGSELTEARLNDAEQSNSSVVFDDDALPEGLPPPRAGDEPGPGDAPLPRRARFREHSAARRVVLVRRPAAGGDARDPAGVRPGGRRRLGAGPGRAGRGARSLSRAPPPAWRGDRLDARGARLRHGRPELLPGDAEPRGARPADRERGRGDRAALPLAAGRPARARADHGPRRGDPRPPAPAHPCGHHGEGDSQPRRPPSRPDARDRRRGVGDPRLRGRAGALAGRAATEALAAPRRRRDAALVRVRHLRRRLPSRLGGAVRLGGARALGVPGRLSRDRRPGDRPGGAGAVREAPRRIRAREGGVRAPLRALDAPGLAADPGGGDPADARGGAGQRHEPRTSPPPTSSPTRTPSSARTRRRAVS